MCRSLNFMPLIAMLMISSCNIRPQKAGLAKISTDTQIINTPLTIPGFHLVDGAEENRSYKFSRETLLEDLKFPNIAARPIAIRFLSVKSGSVSKNGEPAGDGTMLINAGESWTWTPPANRHGDIDAFVFRIEDGSTHSSESNLAIRVAPSVQHAALDRMKIFIEKYHRDERPLIINSAGIVVNAFDDEVGRGGYFPSSAGTTEGQFLMLRGLLRAYQVTGDDFFFKKQRQLFEGVKKFYPAGEPTANSDALWLPHWLINAKYSFPVEGPSGALWPNSPNDLGYLDKSFSFVNGVAVIPDDLTHNGKSLARVTQAFTTDGSLLWQNLFSGIVGATQQFPIAYYVDKYGVKVSPLTGARVANSLELAGTVVLSTPYSGNVRVLYTSFQAQDIAVNQLFESYPAWRSLMAGGSNGEINSAYDALPWAAEIFAMKAQIDPDPFFTYALAATDNTILKTADISNGIDFLMRQAKSLPFPTDEMGGVVLGDTDPFSGVIGGFFENNATSGTAALSRDASSGNVNITLLGSFTGNVNYSVSGHIIKVKDGAAPTEFTLNANSNINTVLGVQVLSSPTFDLNHFFQAPFKTDASVAGLINRTYKRGDFVRWPGSSIWNASSHGEGVYSGGGGSATHSQEYCAYEGWDKNLCWTSVLSNGASGYAGTTVSLAQNFDPVTTVSLPIIYGLNGSAQVRILDNAGYRYSAVLTPGVLAKRFINSSDWLVDPYQTTAGVPPASPSAGNISGFEIIPQGSGVSTFTILLIGDEPIRLSSGESIQSLRIATFAPLAHVVSIGDVRVHNVANQVPAYVPGVVPFTANSLGGRLTNWLGAPYAGYQNVMEWIRLEKWSEINSVYQFWADSQLAYTAQSSGSLSGPFAPVYIWERPESIQYATADTWSWLGPDPNTSWGGFQARAALEAAKGWFRLAPNPSRLPPNASQVVMSHLTWLNNYLKNNGGVFPNMFPAVVLPSSQGNDPHIAALYLKAAIYAKHAGGDKAICDSIISTANDVLVKAIGADEADPMYGAPSNDSAHMKTYGYWIGEALDALALYMEMDSL
ncbi:MAG: hypothetical protein EOP04_06515 [Proteobacteria bacterium]|nr:MAG: hypothetical protein EOP04_06515 [Pseudomonadota bacterium]